MKSEIGVACILAMSVLHIWAEDFRFDSVGARYGFSNTGKTHEFQQIEAFADWRLPWIWRFEHGLYLQPGLGFTAGWLNQYHRDAFIGSMGPDLTFGKKEFPVKVVLGVSPTWLTHTTFETKEFGMPLQFTEHIGLKVEPTRHLLIGYRFQHMSNAHLSHFNPGLDLHTFCVGYQF